MTQEPMSPSPLHRSTQRLRSLLFAPASQPEVLAKLHRSNPDGVVLDLEDAVAPEMKTSAREHAHEAAARLRVEHPTIAVFIRVNAVGSPWFADDVAALPAATMLAGIVVPKVEKTEELGAVVAAAPDHAVLAGIETVLGVADVRRLLLRPVIACYFGAEDFITDLDGVRTPGNAEVLYARSKVAMAARLAGIPALDQVVAAYGDAEWFRRDATEGRALGYAGKLCIHPSQVALAHEAFSPSPDAIDRAQRLLAAYDAATDRGVVTFEGQMVDEPMVKRARSILAAGT